MSDAAHLLRGLPGLDTATEGALQEIAGHFRRRSFKDEALCREGDPAELLWVLAKGTLEVVKRSESGREFVVASLSPPCLFGHVGLFTSAGRTATVRARGSVEVLQMSATQAHFLLRTSPFRVASPFRRALIIALSQQLSAATQTLGRLADEVGLSEPVQGPHDAEARLLKASSSI